MTTINTASTTSTQDTGFKFRNKFKKLLNDENRPIFMAAFREFLGFHPDVARKCLWNLTYRTDPSMTLDKMGLNTQLIPAENIPALRNELRYQYETQHPDFLEVNVPKECSEAFQNLFNCAGPIAAKFLYDQATTVLFSVTTDLDYLLSLLESDEGNKCFGGLREMGFSKEESCYLKTFHEEIYELFNALYEHFCQNIPTSFQNRPFAGLADRLQEAGFKFSESHARESECECTDSSVPTSISEDSPSGTEDTPSTEPESVHSEPDDARIPFVSINGEEILTHKDLFWSLVNSLETMAVLDMLRSYGFDLNEVVKKAAVIKTFLESSYDLEA